MRIFLSRSYGIFQAYYTTHPPFDTASPAAISAIGTVALAIQYVEVLLVILWCKRYPDLVKTMMWSCLALCFVSLFLSSFATKVSPVFPLPRPVLVQRR